MKFKKFNTKPLLCAIAATVLPVIPLTSCDSGPIETGGSSDFNLDDRRAVAAAADPTAIAEMPQFFIEGDSIDFSVNIADSALALGFSPGSAPISVNSTGQITNTEGNSTFPNVNYIYDPDIPGMILTEQNSFPANFNTEAIRDNFEARMEAIEGSPILNNQSLADALNGNDASYLGPEANAIFETSVESIGLIASDQQPLGLGELRGENTTATSVRIRRTVTFTPSTNNDLLATTGVIQGTVTVSDTLINLRVLDPHDGRGQVLALEPTTVIINGGSVAEYNGLVLNTLTTTGTFTINIQ